MIDELIQTHHILCLNNKIKIEVTLLENRSYNLYIKNATENYY